MNSPEFFDRLLQLIQPPSVQLQIKSLLVDKVSVADSEANFLLKSVQFEVDSQPVYRIKYEHVLYCQLSFETLQIQTARRKIVLTSKNVTEFFNVLQCRSLTINTWQRRLQSPQFVNVMRTLDYNMVPSKFLEFFFMTQYALNISKIVALFRKADDFNPKLQYDLGTLEFASINETFCFWKRSFTFKEIKEYPIYKNVELNLSINNTPVALQLKTSSLYIFEEQKLKLELVEQIKESSKQSQNQKIQIQLSQKYSGYSEKFQFKVQTDISLHNKLLTKHLDAFIGQLDYSKPVEILSSEYKQQLRQIINEALKIVKKFYMNEQEQYLNQSLIQHQNLLEDIVILNMEQYLFPKMYLQVDKKLKQFVQSRSVVVDKNIEAVSRSKSWCQLLGISKQQLTLYESKLNTSVVEFQNIVNFRTPRDVLLTIEQTVNIIALELSNFQLSHDELLPALTYIVGSSNVKGTYFFKQLLKRFQLEEVMKSGYGYFYDLFSSVMKVFEGDERKPQTTKI